MSTLRSTPRWTMVCIVLLSCTAGRALAGEVASLPFPTNEERHFFDSPLDENDVRHSLAMLVDAADRTKAVNELSQRAQGHESLIAEYAANSDNMEVREACADIVTALDARFRESTEGKRLADFYRERAEALRPGAWQAFRQEPLDHRAVAILLSLDPDETYSWFSKSNDRYDPIRYLLLRLRESNLDEFAGKRLFEHAGRSVRKALPDVFPVLLAHHDPNLISTSYVGPKMARRLVGHTVLGQIEFDRPISMQRLDGFRCVSRVVHLFEYQVDHMIRGTVVLRSDVTEYRKNQEPKNEDGVERINVASMPEMTCIPLLKISPTHSKRLRARATSAPSWLAEYVPSPWREVVRVSDPVAGEDFPSRLKRTPIRIPQTEGVVLADWPEPPQVDKSREAVAARRKAADVELRRAAVHLAAKDLEKRDYRLALPHIEAAVRLAPDYDEAALKRIRVASGLNWMNYGANAHTEAWHRPAWLAAEYVVRFEPSPELMQSLTETAGTSLRWTGLAGLVRNGTGRLGEHEFRTLESFRRLIDKATSGSIDGASQTLGPMLFAVYRGMKAKGVPASVRQEWLEKVVSRCGRHIEETTLEDFERFPFGHSLQAVLLFRFHAAQLFSEDGRDDRAVAVIRETIRRWPNRLKDPLYVPSREFVSFIDDPKLTSEYEAWLTSIKNAAKLVLLPNVRLEFPSRDPMPVARTTIRHRFPNYSADSGISPLLVDRDRLYVLLTRKDQRPQFAFVPLNGDGSPKRETVELLPQPKFKNERGLYFVGAQLIGNRLFASFRNGEIHHVAPEERAWTRIETDALEIKRLDEMHVLDDGRLYFVARSQDGSPLLFTLRSTSGKSDVAKRTDSTADRLKVEARAPAEEIELARESNGDDDYRADMTVWWEDNQWHGLATYGNRRGIIAGKPRPGDWSLDRYSTLTLAARIGSKWYVAGNTLLHECDFAGNILRRWTNARKVKPVEALLGELSFTVSVPAFLSTRGQRMAAVGDLLAIQGRYLPHAPDKGYVVVFHPRTETLYGPFDVVGGNLLADGDGLWIGGGTQGLSYLAVDRIVELAKKADAVTRMDDGLTKMEPIPRAMMLFAMQRKDRAREVLQGVLDDKPANTQALYLLACLHGVAGEAGREEFERCCDRLIASIDTASAFSGLYLRFCARRNAKDWKGADAALSEILRRFDPIKPYYQHCIEHWQRHIRRQLDSKSDSER